MVKYTDDKITVNGIDLYRLEETDLIGKNVYAAKSASIGDRASIGAEARIGEGASISAGASIGVWAHIGAWASIGAEARIGAGASIGEGASIGDRESIGDRAHIGAWASIGAGASIGEGASIGDRARIGAEARIGDRASYDVMLIGPGGSRNRYTTIWRHKDGHLRVTAGCFTDTLDELDAAAKKTHGDNQHSKYYLAMIEFAKASMGEYRTARREADHATD